MRSKGIFLTFLMVIGCAICVACMAYSATILPTTMSSPLFMAKPTTNALEPFIAPLISLITGASLASGCFFFLLRRMIIQFDRKHDRHEIDINSIQTNMYSFKAKVQDDIHDFETELTNKHHDQSEKMHQEIRISLTQATQVILDNLESLRGTIQEMVEDLAVLKAEHNNCDYNSGDIKVIKNQLENMSEKVDVALEYRHQTSINNPVHDRSPR